jgi:hypothetical protein
MGADRAPTRAWRSLVAGSSERFATPPVLATLVLYALTTVSFGSLRVNNDGAVYYAFAQRLLGEDGGDLPGTRQFGTALYNLPFYAAARATEEVTGLATVLGSPIGEFAIVVGTMVATGLTLFLGWRLLVRLELPKGFAVLTLAVAGSPLFYYAVFQPTYKHVVDALLTTALALLMLRVYERADRPWVLALGACLGALLLVRSANVALVPGALVPLLARREARAAMLALLATAATVAVLLGAVGALGVSTKPGPQPSAVAVGAPQVDASAAFPLGIYWGICEDPGYPLSFSQCLHNAVGLWWDPWAPAKMLFTLERGMFLWTPLTALAVLGFALLVRERRGRRAPLVGLGAAALGLLLVHVGWADFWTGGFSFSQRFLASLFPVYLLGVAELVRRWRAPALAALTACAIYSLLAAFTFFYGWEGISERDGIDTIVSLYAEGERTPWGVARTAAVDALERWHLR